LPPKPKLDTAGKPVPYHISYPEKDDKGNFLSHSNAASVVSAHNWGWAFVQGHGGHPDSGGVRIGHFHGGEAKNAKKHIPIAVILSLLVQGLVCYLFEYFRGELLPNSGYTLQSASGSAAPSATMMVMVGDALFGAGNGRTFMLVEAFTVFLAIIGTTLSCMNTGARVTYAMGKDDEVPEHFGLLHSEEPDAAPRDLDAGRHLGHRRLRGGFRWHSETRALPRRGHQGPASGLLVELRVYYFTMAWRPMPNTLLVVTLASNFGTFLLYGFELRDLHGGLPWPSEVQRGEAFHDSGLRAGGQCWAAWSSTWSGRSWASARARSRCWLWASRWYGPFTARFISSVRGKARGGRRWCRGRVRLRPCSLQPAGMRPLTVVLDLTFRGTDRRRPDARERRRLS